MRHNALGEIKYLKDIFCHLNMKSITRLRIYSTYFSLLKVPTIKSYHHTEVMTMQSKKRPFYGESNAYNNNEKNV